MICLFKFNSFGPGIAERWIPRQGKFELPSWMVFDFVRKLFIGGLHWNTTDGMICIWFYFMSYHL